MFRRWEHEVTGQEIYHQICLPESVVSQVLCALHNDPSAGHLGVSKKCGGDFIGMACGKMSKCTLEGVSHVLK